ncbi:hypothetical protein TNCV_1041731 [Trichonephila clavipes]|nr:hypothetical protein TNCV_1041731 [Trichonephila clavipes]
MDGKKNLHVGRGYKLLTTVQDLYRQTVLSTSAADVLSNPLSVSPYGTQGRHFVEQRQPPTKIPPPDLWVPLKSVPLEAGATW